MTARRWVGHKSHWQPRPKLSSVGCCLLLSLAGPTMVFVSLIISVYDICHELSSFLHHRLWWCCTDWVRESTHKLSKCIWAASWQNPTKWHVRPAKTQISLGIHPVWSESSLSARRKLGSLATHWAHREDSDQTGRMPRLIWIFARRTDHFVGFVTRRLIYSGLHRDLGWS